MSHHHFFLNFGPNPPLKSHNERDKKKRNTDLCDYKHYSAQGNVFLFHYLAPRGVAVKHKGQTYFWVSKTFSSFTLVFSEKIAVRSDQGLFSQNHHRRSISNSYTSNFKSFRAYVWKYGSSRPIECIIWTPSESFSSLYR